MSEECLPAWRCCLFVHPCVCLSLSLSVCLSVCASLSPSVAVAVRPLLFATLRRSQSVSQSVSHTHTHARTHASTYSLAHSLESVTTLSSLSLSLFPPLLCVCCHLSLVFCLCLSRRSKRAAPRPTHSSARNVQTNAAGTSVHRPGTERLRATHH